MANISTSFFGSLGTALSGLASGVGTAISGLAPIAAPIVAAALPALLTPKQKIIYQPTAMPGGAPTMATLYPSSALGYMPGAPTVQQGGFIDQVMPGLMTGLGLGQLPAVQQLMGTAPSGTVGLARTMNVTDQRGRVRTYVLAPMVKYRVSITRAGRRRCSGGR